ncbi:MAG: hypothetical protein O9313_19795 [Acetobacteraceae bacterium]|jgi:hypothetical protein|nr:hypothetical protein [Acetobacteraceae bacterium]
MRGEFIGVWSEMWREIWVKLAGHPAAPHDLFCELFRELEPAFVVRMDLAGEMADIIDDPHQSKRAFRAVKATKLRGEVAILDFLERTQPVLIDLGGDPLGNRFFQLVEQFIEKYSLRYDLRRPFSLHPTLSGVFARLIRELRHLTSQDAALAAIMHDFEETLRDLRSDRSPGRIKACIHRQMTLLEALAQRCPNVAPGSLGDMCDHVGSWPHITVKEAMKKLYGFSSNYPGIRHAGNAASALREIEMRDMVGITVILAGFVPYLSQGLNMDELYAGGGV